MPIINGIVQNTPEWLVKRIGCGTASHCGDMVAKLVRSGEEAARRRDYREDIELERKMRRATERDVLRIPDVVWGIEHQQDAMERYELESGILVSPGGFWLHPRIPFFGASPDYLLPDGKGLIEVKCPTSRTHYRSFKYGKVKEDYVLQMCAQMSVCEREYVDYVSFDPRFPERDDQIWIKRFTRDDPYIRGLEADIQQFLAEVERNTRNGKPESKVVVMAG